MGVFVTLTKILVAHDIFTLYTKSASFDNFMFGKAFPKIFFVFTFFLFLLNQIFGKFLISMKVAQN